MSARVSYPSYHAEQQLDALQALSNVWDEIHSEVILLVLFCAGFILFRFTAVRELVPGIKAGKAGKVVEDPCYPVKPGCPNQARRPSKPAEQLDDAGVADATPEPQAVKEADYSPCSSQVVGPTSSVPHHMVASAIEKLRGAAGEGDRDADPEARARLPAGALTTSLVQAIFNRATKAADFTLVKDVCREASLEKVALPLAACEAVLRGCATAGDSSAVEIFTEFLRLGFKPSESSLTAIVSLCAESRHVHFAEHIVVYARQTYERASLPLYSALMKVYGQSRLWHKICDLYEVIRKDGVEPDIVTYGCLIKAAVESGRTELARHLFKESGNPDLLNYMSLIRAAGREKDVNKALRLLAELERSPLSADVTAYNCVLEACAACNDRASAEGLLNRMTAAGHVDVVSYNTYLKVLLASNAHMEVSSVLEQMRRRGCPPNVITFNSMIRDAVSRQDTSRAWSLVNDMEQLDVRPDAFTCSILVKGVKNMPRVEDIDRIIALVKRASIVPDEVLVNCLLDVCMRLRDPQRLTQVLDQFKATGVMPSPHAYATLIRAYGHVRRPDRVWDLWRELTSGPASLCTEEAFAAMVEACLASGDINGALAVVREVQSQLSGFPRAPAVFAALVKFCIQCKQGHLAVELYGEIKDLIVCSKVSYNTLIDALVRQGDTSRANDLFRDMTLKNVSPDLITYSTLIKGHCSRGDLEQGLQLLGLMQRRGIAPDAVLFNSILDGCAHKQMRTLTEQVLRDMEVAGIAPSNFTLSILVKLYGRCGDLEAAFQVVGAFPAQYGFKVNAQVFTCLMSACIANNELPRALGVHVRMTESGCAADWKTYQTLISGCLRNSELQSAARLLSNALECGMATRLDTEVAEAVLLMAVRRGRGSDVAVPLLDELQEAGIAVSARTVAAVRQDTDMSHLRRATMVPGAHRRDSGDDFPQARQRRMSART